MTKSSVLHISHETLDTVLFAWAKAAVVNSGDRLSDPVKYYIEVPQASILEPLLFSVYINKTLKTLRHTNETLACPEVQTHMYGDDTVLYVHG